MPKRKTLVAVLLAMLVGVSLGLIIASNFEWTRSGLAEQRLDQRAGTQEPMPAGDADLMATSKAYVNVARKVMPTVVSITSQTVVRTRHPFTGLFHEDWWRGRSRERGRSENEYRQEGLGSGVIISSEGYILTNNHVIREAESIAVLIDRKEYKARVVGTDPKTDLAVIKIDEKALPVAQLGNSDELEVGEIVLAVGNPFFLQLAHSVTAGIVSGKGRTRVGVGDIDYEDFIQTDAAINPGNSGGALVNLRGEVVGINTAIVSSGWGGGNVGIGFAIPINLARKVMEQLVTSGKVVRGWLGVYIQSADQELAEAMKLPSLDGALVTAVTPGSPAAAAGLAEGDFIVGVDNQRIRDHNHLMNLVADYKPDTRVTIRFVRDGREKVITAKLEERPERDAEPEISASESPALGLTLEDLSPELAMEYSLDTEAGVVVTQVQHGSQAQRQGLRPGDVIREINRRSIATVAEFRRHLALVKAGEVVLLRVARQSGNFFVALKLEND